VLFSRQPTPFLTTLHTGSICWNISRCSSIPVISISNAQRRPVPQSNWVRTIHHGLPEKLLTPQPVTPGYLAVVCTENLNPNVLTMKSAQYGARIYDAGSLNLARDRRILVQ